MRIPKNFQFSQKSLSDYAACKRLFKYRYLDKIEWPAVEIEPVKEREHRMKLGADFHRALQQFFVGVPRENIENQFADALLSKWWRNLESSLDKIIGKDDIQLPEVRISAPIKEHRFIAKLDLIVVKPDGRRIIFDWKTSSKRPNLTILSNHMQTRVYPYLLLSAGDHVYPWEKFSPQQVEMVYWFAEHPGNPEKIIYSEVQFQEDEDYLNGLVSEICVLTKLNFHKTDDERRCRLCVYRSLCDRGIEAGNFEEIEDLYLEDTGVENEFDFDQITEIEY